MKKLLLATTLCLISTVVDASITTTIQPLNLKANVGRLCYPRASYSINITNETNSIQTYTYRAKLVPQGMQPYQTQNKTLSINPHDTYTESFDLWEEIRYQDPLTYLLTASVTVTGAESYQDQKTSFITVYPTL
jgi:hypothetical protein